MKKIKRWRYYCDHCKKSGGSGGHMKNHEAACTRNPDRKCGLCARACLDQKNSDDLVEVIKKNIVWKSFENENEQWAEFKPGATEKEVLKELREITDGCPACMLTAIRLSGAPFLFNELFNWKKERDSFFKECIPEPGDYY